MRIDKVKHKSIVLFGLMIGMLLGNSTSAAADISIKPYGKLLAIFGGDNLTIVEEEHRTTYPYSAIVALTTYYADGTMGQSTGIMIDRNTLLTCGHCVYDPISGMATGLEAVPGRDNDSWPFGSTYATDIYVMDQWLKSAEEAEPADEWYSYTEDGFDLAVVRLADNIGDVTGWMKLHWQEEALNGVAVTLTGYPAGYRMKTAKGIVLDGDRETFIYRVDSEPGTSGCPIYVTNSDGSYSVVGVNKSNTSLSNGAVKLTKEKYEWILSCVPDGNISSDDLGNNQGENITNEYSMDHFDASMYSGNWEEVISGFQACIPADWSKTKTDENHIYSASNKEQDFFVAATTADQSAVEFAAELISALFEIGGVDTIKLYSNYEEILDFFMDIYSIEDVTVSNSNGIHINGIPGETNSLYINDFYLQAVRFEDKSGNPAFLLIGNFSEGKISATLTNMLHSFQMRS